VRFKIYSVAIDSNALLRLNGISFCVKTKSVDVIYNEFSVYACLLIQRIQNGHSFAACVEDQRKWFGQIVTENVGPCEMFFQVRDSQ